jgi:transposase/IS5 family transposase
MLGRRSPQRELFRPDQLLLEHVGPDTFYGVLARRGSEIFRDQDFAELYGGAVGRPSVPPSQLCVLLLLQAREGCSDAEAIERTAYDLRWKVALGLELEDKLCAKSTLQMFRAKLVLHEAHGKLFEKSVDACRQAGLLKQRKLEVAIDTTPVLGRGAVKDTFNLISEQIREVVRAACELKGWDEDGVVAEQGLSRHFGTSFKGEVELDWSDADAKRALVAQLVADARIALSLAREALRGYSKAAEGTQRLREAQRLLSELLLQDVEEEPDDGGGPSIRQGTARDRVISRTDPEMRHGHKSHSKPFDGYKASVVVDTHEGVILATDVRAANVADAEGAAQLIQRAGKAAKQDPARVLGDTAYGGIATRKELAEQGIEVIAKAPPVPGKAFFTHVDFRIDERRGEARCPADRSSIRRSPARNGVQGWTYHFSRNDCNACALRNQCAKSETRARTVTVTEHTKVLNKLRRAQKTERFRNTYRRRVAVEHRIGRLVALGIRQARYFGQAKVAFQVLLAATVANLTLAASSSHREACLRGLHRLVAAAASILALQPGRSAWTSTPTLGVLGMAGFRPAL